MIFHGKDDDNQWDLGGAIFFRPDRGRIGPDPRESDAGKEVGGYQQGRPGP